MQAHAWCANRSAHANHRLRLSHHLRAEEWGPLVRAFHHQPPPHQWCSSSLKWCCCCQRLVLTGTADTQRNHHQQWRQQRQSRTRGSCHPQGRTTGQGRWKHRFAPLGEVSPPWLQRVPLCAQKVPSSSFAKECECMGPSRSSFGFTKPATGATSAALAFSTRKLCYRKLYVAG